MNKIKIELIAKLFMVMVVIFLTTSNLIINSNSGGIEYSLKALEASAWESSEKEKTFAEHEQQYDSWLHDDIDEFLYRCVNGFNSRSECETAYDDYNNGKTKWWTGRHAGSIGFSYGGFSFTYNIKDCDPGGDNC